MRLNLEKLAPKYRAMVNELSVLLPVEDDKTASVLTVEKAAAQTLQVSFEEDAVVIAIAEDFMFARALGLVAQHLEKKTRISEKMIYPQLEAMIDASRNAVMHYDSFCRMVRYFALMGYSGIQMYTEDTYEVEGYPYFGYMRGRYTKAELKQMDDYCALFGMELIPCIQTLAHLGKTMRWAEYADYTDFDDILLVDDERTYALIEAMIRSMSQSLRSRRINIGMDEAHMLGLGKYRDQHGEIDRMDLMLRHFNRVKGICDKYGYRAMMWSDMFFRILNNDQYESNVEISPEKAALIPKDVDLVYWNYYSTDRSIYEKMLEAHQKMSPNISFASGAWRWSGFGPHNSFSYAASIPAHESCKQYNIKQMLVTSWGDDGGEASTFSVLPSFLLWAECDYEDNYSKEHLAARFAICTGGESLSDFAAMDLLTDTPENPTPSNEFCGASPSKQLLYQDVLCGLFDRHVTARTAPHYFETAKKLHEGEKRSPQLGYVYAPLALLAEICGCKAELALSLRKAYRAKEADKLADIANIALPRLYTLEEEFIRVYSDSWLKENKVFGLDLFDIRMGGQTQRVQRAISRLKAYLCGALTVIPELEENVLYYDCRPEGEYDVLAVNDCNWINLATAAASRNNKSY